MMSEFWFLDVPIGAKRTEVDQGNLLLEVVDCPINAGHRRPGKRINNLAVVFSGDESADIVWTWESDLIVSNRLVELLRGEQLTGWSIRPVQVVSPSKTATPRWELSPHGWGGLALPASGVRLKERCEGCGLLVYGGLTDPSAIVDIERWDHSDMFLVWPLPRFVLCTARLVEAFVRHDVTGVSFKRLAELHVSDPITPGRLSYWMPRDLADRHGAGLGIA